MKFGSKYLLAILLLEMVLALVLRTHNLNERPMHTDEAVQALKFSELLETGQYKYDPKRFHGPTLYYFTLPVAWLRGQKDLQQIDEHTVRLVSAIIGSALVLSLFWLRDGLGKIGLLTAGALITVSPAMVYYSRYYIQEMLLVTFTAGLLGCGWRYYRDRRLVWAVGIGVFAGLMHATKESCLISWFAILAALTACWITAKRVQYKKPDNIGLTKNDTFTHGISACTVAVIVSVTFYSSFFSNLQGVWDSLIAPFTYSLAPEHEKPIFYYLRLLTGLEGRIGVLASEITIVGFALAGAIISFREDWLSTATGQLRRFLTYYTLTIFLIYSLLPYKTPWLILSALLGLVLMAGSGLEAICNRSQKLPIRAGITAIFLSALAVLCQGALLVNFRYYADERNPYAYVHPNADVLKIEERLKQLAALSPDGQELRVNVISEEYWPLPWYLRGFNQVGYWSEIPEHPDASVIIVSAKFQEALDTKLLKQYQVEYRGLRPGVILLIYIEKELWDNFLREITRKS